MVDVVDDTYKSLHEQLTNVRLDLRELSTKMDAIKDISKKLEELDDVAKKAYDSSKSAHHRIDRIEKIHWWIFTVIGGTAITTVVVFALKGGFVKL